MGCDIHAHFEINWKGTWLYYSPLRISRDYELFSYLADVRNVPETQEDYIKPISDPRGLPEDVSLMTQIHSDIDGVDGHSHSWISSKEYIRAEEEYKFNGRMRDQRSIYSEVYLFGNGFAEFFQYKDDYPKECKDFRLVFWFDN